MKREINPKQKALLDTAKDLFWKFGYKKVSIEEICRKANVSKMTFYKFFPNKLQIAKEILLVLYETASKNFEEMMHSDITPKEKIHRIILMKMENTNQISKEFLDDMYFDLNSDLHKFVMEQTDKIWQSTFQTFREAQAKGWFREDFKPEFVIAASFKMMELMNDEKVMSLYGNAQDFIKEITNFVAFGITPEQ
ncbi:MAG: hypothetical protein A2X64_08630 [Ignavibacteria bacterium GWF2_33_9]|nr:MAG: hypothetical protein A2X64_08630 [Ignavibacteria bacterium GWF2_33_9]